MENEKKSLENLVLDLVNGEDYRPAKPKAIARQLKLPEDSYPALRKTIKKLVKKGRLAYATNHLVCAAGSDPGLVTGVFRRTAGGFGFVRPSAADKAAGITEDVYVSRRNGRDASTGDRVRVRVSEKPGKGLRGTVTEILERETYRFVGTLEQVGGESLVRVDGKVFAHSIPVGDPSAKAAYPDDKVVIELVSFPSHYQIGEGVIVEVLGNRNEPGVDTLSVIREFNLPEEFAEDVLADARKQADAFDVDQIEGRHDWTERTTITIDPVDARDFDDAISLQRLENGHWELAVHIADVSYFVPRRSDLDTSARDRATSVYLPDRVLPMLPELISNHLASLQPERKRLTKTVIIEFTEEGIPVGTELQNAIIQSDRRFTYEEVDDYLKTPQLWQEKLSKSVFEMLDGMHRLAMTLRRRRLTNGALELNLPEVKIDLDRNGEVEGAHYVEHTVSHQIIEEFMLAANEAVARWITDRDLPFLRRVHEQPAEKKLSDLTSFVRGLGVECEPLHSRFEIQRLLDIVANSPQEPAINFAVLKSMQKAVYSPQDSGHYALNSECYCHFTSPIRRYPDLTIHRLVDEILAGRTPEVHLDALFHLGDHCSERERRAEQAERELVKIKLFTLLAKHIGMKLEAVITGVEDYGFYAQGIRLPAEGLVHINSLTDDYYHHDRTAHLLEGNRKGNRFQLGDVVIVEVTRSDVDKRLLDLRFVERVAEDDNRYGSADSSPYRVPAKASAQPSGREEKQRSGRNSSERKRSGKRSSKRSSSKRSKGKRSAGKAKSSSASGAKKPARKKKGKKKVAKKKTKPKAKKKAKTKKTAKPKRKVAKKRKATRKRR